ncbi:MAG TPA: Uma2 family endonuclease [Chloroflexota bacterium]|nr:Uma2 family endonuclease [Chloroflexota bacterium]
MTQVVRWTSADLELLPDDGKRYEIVDGELFVSKQPDWHHQLTCGMAFSVLQVWSARTGQGIANIAPGVVFGADDDVAPDVVWVSRERLSSVLEDDGKLHAAPDLVIEVLSPGRTNERRDREAKLKLYSQRGVREYWIVDWRLRLVEVYRRAEMMLHLAETLHEEDALSSPLLPGFSCPVGSLFAARTTS